MKIATWNLQRPAMTGARVEALLKHIRAIAADVWILTETRDNIDLSADGYHGASTDEIESMHRSGERRTTIWSREPIVQKLPTHCPATAVCVELGSSPVGPMIVYGTIIPYGNAAGRYAYHSAGEDRDGLKAWDLHYESIALHQRDLVSLRERFPNHGRCFAGDFNQSRDGRMWNGRHYYGTPRGRDLLTECLQASGLECVTADDFVAAGQVSTQSLVDHICLDHSSAKRVQARDAWEAPNVGDKRSSDHCGVCVALD